MDSADGYWSAVCLDDLLRYAVEALLARGRSLRARRGTFLELTGVVLRLTNPCARLSRTESRGRPISALGEFCWYMNGSDSLADISHYVPAYTEDAVDGVLPGAYGPRLVGRRDGDQLNAVIELLAEHPTSRRAVIRLFDAGDLRGQADVPCTCTLQYLVRDGRLEAITYMRSNDAHLGLPHDVFCFTLLQEYVARCLGVELGKYTHMVGSLHLYERDRETAARFLDEGFQSTESPMPSMPNGSPEAGIQTLLAAEKQLRADQVRWDTIVRTTQLANDYWADLIRLLHVFRLCKDFPMNPVHSTRSLKRVRAEFAHDVYQAFVDRQIARLDRGEPRDD